MPPVVVIEMSPPLMLQSASQLNPFPAWFHQDVISALLAPTAVNQQKFFFEYVGKKGGHYQVKAHKGFSMVGFTRMDLGIVKYHFEVGSGDVNFKWV